MGLVVAGRHEGSLLGYDRRAGQGPWLLRVLIRRLHRNAGFAPWGSVGSVDWAERRVVLTTSALGPLVAP